jgi:hypothetical protein
LKAKTYYIYNIMKSTAQDNTLLISSDNADEKNSFFSLNLMRSAQIDSQAVVTWTVPIYLLFIRRTSGCTYIILVASSGAQGIHEKPFHFSFFNLIDSS